MDRYSVILMDIDGTLLDSRNAISPNTKKLLERLRKKGVPIALVSGGMPGEVERVARLANVRAPIVCYHGALILDESRSILEDTGIGKDDALSFKAFVNGEFPDVSVNSYLYDVWLTDNPDDKETRRLAESSQGEPLRGDLASAMRMSSRVHKFLCAGAFGSLRELKERAGNAFPALDVTFSSPACLEIVRKGVSKRAAMETIQRHYRISAAQIVAVGDCRTDIAMLDKAGMGIAMGNAPEAVRKAADRVTASNDDEGVYIALKGLRFQPPPPRGASGAL
jgi:hypothetical protein